MTTQEDEPLEHSGAEGDSWGELRQRAEEKMRRLPVQNMEEVSPGEVRRLNHELRVHQIELEMQNEELRKTQGELEAALARYVDLYDLAPVGYVTLNEAGVILEANLRAATMLGTHKAAIISQPLTRSILPEDQDIYYRHRQQLLASGEPHACELRMKRPDGAPLWARLEATLVRDWEKGVLCYRVTLSDVTERKKAEEEKGRLQAALFQARRMESVGRLAGGVAHNFNNRLGIVVGYAELASEKLEPGHPVQRELQATLKAAQDCAGLSQLLLAYARKQLMRPQLLDLNQAVMGMDAVLRRLVGPNIGLFRVPGDGLWQTSIDPAQVGQILISLCTNAREAITGPGRVTVATENTVLDAEYCAGHPGCVPGEYAMLAVRDNGCGMDQELVKHLFEPFFTTKEVNPGMGLASVYGIVKQNHGFIDVASEPGRGTIIRVYLPRGHSCTQKGAKHPHPYSPVARPS